MGVCDNLKCEVELPGLGLRPDLEFQTKLFGADIDLTISRDGRLIEHRKKYEYSEKDKLSPGSWFPKPRIIDLGDQDLEFHGDLSFYTSIKEKELVEYVARFTNGQLEWMRRIEDLSEQQRSQLRA